MRFFNSHRRVRSRLRLTVFVLCLLAAVVAVVSPIKHLNISVAAAGAPVLLTQEGPTRAIALDSVMRLAEPFQSQNPVSFASDNRTRIVLFATNLTLATGENASAVSAEAEDFSHARYPLAVEYVGAVPAQTWMTAVVVRLNDNLGGDVGDILVGITYHGATSNRVRIGLGHIGGGPPDDPPASPTPTPSPGATPDLGPGASFHGKQLFPPDNPWNQDISGMPVDPNSANLIAGIGMNTGLHPDFGTVYNGAPNGIPYVVVTGAQPRVAINYTAYGDESDPGPYPVPPNAPIEGGPNSNGDRHVLVIDRDNWKLYELGRAFPVNSGASWNANCGAIFDLNSNALRPAGWTSADAAGLPIFPGLVRYDEVFEQGVIAHAIRFTVQDSRRAYVHPARHWASDLTSANLPPMGMRVRLKASFDISGFSAPMHVILRAMKKYGMIVADNGSNWYFSGAPDPRWDDDELSTLKSIKGSNFEVVQMGTIVTP
ncbi:MAG TPA: hypothetical protein VGO56_08030 [Pyrinomonadaceae bacterium]|jgi:hypothetical protein|nr:hypothetical protein [Pyrinomonadaceae bacterium]